MTNTIFIEKIVLNFRIPQADSNYSKNLVNFISTEINRKPKKIFCRKNIKNFNIRPGKICGYKITFRKKHIDWILPHLLHSKQNTIRKYNIINSSITFGVINYLDVPIFRENSNYSAFGFDVNIVFSKFGKNLFYKKKNLRKKIPSKFSITPTEISEFLLNKFPELKIK